MKLAWTIERKQQVHRLRRAGKHTAEIAELTGRTKGAIDRLLSIEKKRGISHDKIKPKHLKYDCQTIRKWRELRKTGMTYPAMAALLQVNAVTICIRLGREAQGLLRW